MIEQIIKKDIIDQLIRKLNKELADASEASESTSNYTKSDDLQQEGKYDTRAIEAGYLAGAQRKRVEEIKVDIKLLKDLPIRHFSPEEEIAIGALIELELNGKTSKYFISPSSGGALLSTKDGPVMVISAYSPIGSGAIGLKSGDSFELETPKETREYNIFSVL